MNHSFSRAQSLLCSSQESSLTISLHKKHMIFFCFFMQQSFGILQLTRLSLQHTTNPRIKAMSTKSIRTEHMNKWKPRALWTKVIFWGQIPQPIPSEPIIWDLRPIFQLKGEQMRWERKGNVTSQGILGRPNSEWGLTQLRHPRCLWVDGKANHGYDSSYTSYLTSPACKTFAQPC